MTVGDTLTIPELIAAWRADQRAGGSDPTAAERSRVAQSAFAVDLAGDPPAFASTWIPDWVRDRAAFADDRLQRRVISARIAREWAALPPDAYPFEGMLEAPFVICALYERHVKGGGALDSDVMLTELVCTLWNLKPASTAAVSTAAQYRTGTAARLVRTSPPDDESIACPRCGWTGLVGETEVEYFEQVSHRECPRCAKILLVMAG